MHGVFMEWGYLHFSSILIECSVIFIIHFGVPHFRKPQNLRQLKRYRPGKHVTCWTSWPTLCLPQSVRSRHSGNSPWEPTGKALHCTGSCFLISGKEGSKLCRHFLAPIFCITGLASRELKPEPPIIMVFYPWVSGYDFPLNQWQQFLYTTRCGSIKVAPITKDTFGW